MTAATTHFIADVSSNHNRDLRRATKLIQAAAKVGCEAVEFQLFRVDELFSREILRYSPEHRERMDWELPEAFIPELAAASEDAGIAFGASPFFLEAVELLEPYVSFFKLSPYELVWDNLLRTVARTGKPVILSTALADLAEVDRAARLLLTAGCKDLTLLHGTAAYPAQPDQVNLRAIETMRTIFEGPIGFCDYTRNDAVIRRAALRWGAPVVSFHLDLDGEGAEFAGGHCWLPEEVAPLIKELNEGIQADGHGLKEPSAVEKEERLWRTDPEDGLRPFREVRPLWVQKQIALSSAETA